ncbi:hypothetical protein LCGC14_0974500 [marine sediment metagenome]|uniref:Uncharacterized protein n=1 Tax=marine sediment metagenome TaxID=412755 RepID=A0A0F9NAJ7_9ZZZZ
MSVSETDICNMALMKIGAKPLIASLSEDSDNARLCNTFYAAVRDAVLRSHPWNCALHRKTITALSTAPDSDWDNQYQLPTNPWCLRILQVGKLADQPTRWTIEGRRLLTDEDSPPIVYVKRITDTNEFDALLIDAFVLKLAIKLAMPASCDKRIAKNLIDELESISLPEARSIDGQEASVQTIQIDTWNDVRF